MPHGGRDGQWITCDPSGHCLWTARTSVAGARVRIYEATRGPVPKGSHIESACGGSRCVNLDHLRIVSGKSVAAAAGPGTCRRGHELTAGNVVRHRDGRVAYCRICRNERRHERYHGDPTFARPEIAMQRRLRRRGSQS